MSTYIGKVQIGTKDADRASIGSTLYGICATPHNTTAKIVILPEFNTLTHGVTVFVRFIDGNTVTSGVTLTIGSTVACAVQGNCVCTANSVLCFTLDQASGITSDEPAIHNIESNNPYYWRVVNSLDITTSTNSGSTAINVNGLSFTGFAPINNPVFLGEVILPGVTTSANANVAVTKEYVDNIVSTGIGGISAMAFKGTIGTNGTIQTIPTSGYLAGETYYVTTSGTYAGQVCEIGDLIIATHSGPETAGDVINADWAVAQTNINGAVITSENQNTGKIAFFDGNNSIKGLIATSSAGTGFLKQTGEWENIEDTKVSQVAYTATSSADIEYNILFKYTSGDTSTTDSVYYTNASNNTNKLTFSPSTGIITAKEFNGTLNPINLLNADANVTATTFLHQSGSWNTLGITNNNAKTASVNQGVLILSDATIALGIVT